MNSTRLFGPTQSVIWLIRHSSSFGLPLSREGSSSCSSWVKKPAPTLALASAAPPPENRKTLPGPP